jgi:hypothetical protein
VTPERLRDFLAHPDVKESAKARVKKLVGELYEAGEWDTLPDEPEMFMLEFQETRINDHLARGTAEPDEREIYGKLAAAIDRHEPRDVRTVRRLSGILADADTETRNQIGELMCCLHNELGLSDLHPDLFPVLAAVYFREARGALKASADSKPHLRRLLRELEEIAKGGDE